MSSDSYNRVYINCKALQQNFTALQSLAGNQVRVLPMIKSDAYGHGMVESAKALTTVGANAFGVAEVEEGIALRKAGIKAELLVFLGTYDFADIIEFNLTPVVFDQDNLRKMSAYAEKSGAKIGVHLKVDTGMGRLGIMPGELPVFASEIAKLPGVFLAGGLSHFPMADSHESPSTQNQNQLFNDLISRFDPNDSEAGEATFHIANSAAMISFPETLHQMVRPGISLYGCYPSADEQSRQTVELQPVMSFATQIVQLKDVPSDYGISYGHLYTTKRPSKLAILPVGYADGYLRSLTGKAQVVVRGQRVPVLGRICMNATVVDVTDVKDVAVMDEVILMGKQGWKDKSEEITADEVAGWMNTISYEVLCLFGNSNHRVYQ